MGGVVTSLVFQPPELGYPNDPNITWIKTTSGAVIPVCFVDRQRKLTILFSHGNAEDLGSVIPAFKYLADVLGVNVIAYDYFGYGLSEGTPSEAQVYMDVQAVYDYATNDLGIKPSQIIVYGRSVGSGPTTYLASQKQVAGVILQSPLASVFRVVFNSRFTMYGDMFPNIDRIGKVTAPVLIIHGTADETVPYWHGVALFEECQKPVKPLWIDGGQHNDLEMNYKDAMISRLKEFVQFIGASTQN